MTIEEFRAYVDRLPKAAHEMEHVTNLGKIISNGFVLLGSELRRGFDRLGSEFRRGQEPVDHQAIAAKREAERNARRDRLRAELAELDDAPEAPAV